MKYSVKILTIIFLLIPLNAYPLNLDHMLDKGPLITINRDNKEKFESITTYALIYAPLQYVWDTVLNIEDYARYMPRMVKSEVIKRNEDNTEIIAAFELDTAIHNTKYTLKYSIDAINRTIAIDHHSGALKGSQWHWEFQAQEEDTIIICTGASNNFSAFIKTIDDSTQTLTVGINIMSMLANIRYIKERSELLYADDKEVSKKVESSSLSGYGERRDVQRIVTGCIW
jgi:ribosome-associated toxin RatA of RatAB toxin-antitoxin module